MLWNVASHERLVGVWNLDGEDATRAVIWAMGRLVEAVERDEPPPTG